MFGRPKIMGPDGEERTFSYWNNRFLFQGREYIGEIGVYDYRNRFYHPDLGRFLQVDPTGFDAGDMNLFRYCGDDPVDFSDPTGLVGQYQRLTSDQGGEWISGANGLGDIDKLNHFPARISMMAVQVEGETKGQKEARTPGTITREANTWVEPIRGKNGEFIANIIHIRWTYTVKDTTGKPMGNVFVKEDISRSNPKCFAPTSEKRGNFWTSPPEPLPINGPFRLNVRMGR